MADSDHILIEVSLYGAADYDSALMSISFLNCVSVCKSGEFCSSLFISERGDLIYLSFKEVSNDGLKSNFSFDFLC